MRSKRAALGLATAILAIAFGSGMAAADPDDPGTAGTGPDSELCQYPDVNNPYCTNFPDDHNNEGDMGNGHDEGGMGDHR
ncbi:hypothetical protein ACQP06_30070 [Nocardia sp. CA-136227]|uniref:hypothetical protein n=1 Tax=Nocardia sp. CA-136227 TaxID=3239979 RepID=UPI003D991282